MGRARRRRPHGTRDKLFGEFALRCLERGFACIDLAPGAVDLPGPESAFLLDEQNAAVLHHEQQCCL